MFRKNLFSIKLCNIKINANRYVKRKRFISRNLERERENSKTLNIKLHCYFNIACLCFDKLQYQHYAMM